MVNFCYVTLKLIKLGAKKHLKQKRMCQKKNQPVNKLKISDHEEPPSLMNKNQMRGTYLLTYSLLEKKLLKLLIWIPPKPKQITGYVHWSQIKKDVNIITSQSN